jgi:hypothetical protein
MQITVIPFSCVIDTKIVQNLTSMPRKNEVDGQHQCKQIPPPTADYIQRSPMIADDQPKMPRYRRCLIGEAPKVTKACAAAVLLRAPAAPLPAAPVGRLPMPEAPLPVPGGLHTNTPVKPPAPEPPGWRPRLPPPRISWLPNLPN